MKRTKRLLSLLLAMMMVFAMASTAFAAGSSVLTINTVNGHTYNIYQMLKGDVSGVEDGSGVLANITAGANLKNSDVTGFLEAIKDKKDAELGDIAFTWVADVQSPKEVIEGNGNQVKAGVDDGYYLVVDTYTGGDVTDGSDTVSRYMVAVVGDTEMSPKTSTPSIDKKIIDTDANKAIDGDYQKTDTAAIGDTIEYEVTGAVPNTEGYKYYYYVLHDTLSKGLTLDEDSFAVTVNGAALTKGTDYYVYVTKNADGTTSFELAFANMKAYTAGNAISVKYNATVNDDAEIGIDPNTNKVNLEYSNNPGSSTRNDVADKPGVPGTGTATGEGPVLITKTYVTELAILKVDQDGKKLEGAEFTLTGGNLNKVIVKTNTTFEKVEEGQTGEYYKLTNGTYTKTAPSEAAEDEEGYNADQYESTTPEYVRVTTITTSTEATGDPKQIVGKVNDEGYIIFTGLNVGEYTLTETKTPTGYNTISPITFTISATQTGSSTVEGGKITWSSSNASIKLDEANGVFDATIVNRSGSQLPSTGGIGTRIFYILGGLLAVGAAVLLITKKRMKAEH